MFLAYRYTRLYGYDGLGSGQSRVLSCSTLRMLICAGFYDAGDGLGYAGLRQAAGCFRAVNVA